MWLRIAQLALAMLIDHASSEPAIRMGVLVYDYARLGPDVLNLAESEAGRVFRAAGIYLEWVSCPLSQSEAARYPRCNLVPGPTTPVLRILPGQMQAAMGQRHDSFGFAMFPPDGSAGWIANVFAAEAEKLASRSPVRSGVLLGAIAAHELGHLLLGQGRHSDTGIMRARWGPKDLERAEQGRLEFSADQCAQLRRNFELRLNSARPAK
jgi:hypothetical protein